jgi:hypothetical protein
VIEPALTAEEWAQTRIEPISLNGTLVVHDDGDGLEVVTYETPGDVATMAKFKIDTWDRDGIAGVIALANTALPDNDPRKLMAADVAALDEAIMYVGPLADREEPLRAELTALRDKLAALLPPNQK